MNNVPKWLVRAGSLLVMLGFFLPAVSCTTLGGLVNTPAFSINDLAQLQQPILYLVLIGALGALAAAFVPARDSSADLLLWIGEAVGLGVGALAIAGILLTLSSQLGQLGAGVGADYGFFVLLLGYGLGGAGAFVGILQNRQRAAHLPRVEPPMRHVESPPALQASPPRAPELPCARLELVRGNAPSSVRVEGTDFLIGRSHTNHLVLEDRAVSGLHVRLRYAQGAWFLQDQKSSNGTFVNGKPVMAQRLNDGDQIRVGDTTYVFRL